MCRVEMKGPVATPELAQALLTVRGKGNRLGFIFSLFPLPSLKQ